MMDPVRELKTRAEILQKRLGSGDAGALARLRALAEWRGVGAGAPTIAAMANDIRRKHCLAVVARECGFGSWQHARRVLEGDPRETDFGTLLYPTGAGTSGTLHPWFSSYEEARAGAAAAAPGAPRRFLLAYKRDFFLAGPDFVRSLGIDPHDGDWAAIGWDWARPAEPEARRRLYAKRLAALQETP